RRAVECSLVVEDDVHGDRSDERRHTPFVLKRMQESAALQLLYDLRRDAAADVETADRLERKRQIARRRAVNFDEQIKRLDGQLSLVRQRSLRHGRSLIAARDLFGEPVRLVRLFRVAQETIDIEETGAGQRALVRDVPAELLSQVTQQRDFCIIARREVCVPAFGGDRVITPAIPEETGHAEASARSDQGAMTCARLI